MTTLPLLRGNNVSLDDALADDDNILHRLDYPRKQKDFWSHLISLKAEIEIRYNVCIPICINPPSENHVLVRIPLPYKIGEEIKPGNVDEKLRCEAATYIWIRQNCPNVPIPSLHGFAFPDGQTFVEPACVSLFSRLRWRINWVVRSWLGFPTSCPYVGLQRLGALRTGSMIIGYIKSGRMLSDSWGLHLQDTIRRKTLFNDLANIILSLNRTQLPRIGSLTVSNDGIISLTNRPLTLRLQTFENEGIPTIPYNSTYQSPNAIHDVKDGQERLAALTMMRGLLHQFISRQYRHGPFVLTLTDLHPSNIFVDEDWHITSLIDLEWACAFPVELQAPPYWLTGRPIDDIERGEDLETFEKVVIEFMEALDEQEKVSQRSNVSHAQIVRSCWDRGSFCPKGLLRVFNEHIQSRFSEEHCTQSIFDRTVTDSLIEKKLKEEESYKDGLRKRFNL
ncbi:hypothetical protein BO94DRAFT_569142 [Aspergillus sclerotioniger CBS 115572]|uniref:Uncharacterized protein n=1 Tax=Aspergillus sclerotioniger CBS 115572 TaxID=1450535 RepID=A0A317VCR1_9EURO|nr:hypothetical protein BO94DRAFT_569142 [Aspergillus sclerotioniger CBS 115572]PWY72153.1 hypothetical protein BO94DRAFT_569142 [Aspergillus sclerotioniger CBS 115572]